MNHIKAILEDQFIQRLEKEIILIFNHDGMCDECLLGGYMRENYKKYHFMCDYGKYREILEIRREAINRRVLKYQEELLPDIIAFNDALRAALHKLFIKAQKVYDANKQFCEKIDFKACCYLNDTYPALHPVQSDNREDLWTALCDSEWNVLYEDGVNLGIWSDNWSFDDFILNVPPPNWNEGLDRELTKDLHLIFPFHNLFDHTSFAITDFIYCRKFYTEIDVEIRN